MVDYDLPAELRIALRKAKKKSTLGGALILLGTFWPISVEIGLLKNFAFDTSSAHPLLNPFSANLGKILTVAGLVGIAVGIGIVAIGWMEGDRAQSRVDAWRANSDQPDKT